MDEGRLEGTLNGSAHPNGTAYQNGTVDEQAAKIESQAAALHRQWATDPRWAGIERTYTAADVVKLRGSVQEEHTLARLGAERLWALLHEDGYVNALGAMTGNQAVQQVRAGLKAIYLSGWQVAADANLAGPDLPRPEPVPGQLGPGRGAPDQQRAAARGPDHAGPSRRTRARRTGWRRSWPTPRPASAAC